MAINMQLAKMFFSVLYLIVEIIAIEKYLLIWNDVSYIVEDITA